MYVNTLRSTRLDLMEAGRRLDNRAAVEVDTSGALRGVAGTRGTLDPHRPLGAAPVAAPLRGVRELCESLKSERVGTGRVR